MNKILITNGRIIDPATDTDMQGDLYIADGLIVEKAAESVKDFTPDFTIDATNLIISPGLVDLDASLGCVENLDQIKNELSTAIASGVTTLCMPPIAANNLLQNSAGFEWFLNTCNKLSPLKIIPVGSLTRDLAGTQLNEIGLLKEAGCIVVSNDSNALQNSEIKRRCYEYAASLDLKIFIYAIDPWLKEGGCLHEGELSTRLGLKGIPTLAETTAFAQELVMLEELGISAHFCRLSSGKSLDLLHRLKPSVTADLAAYQLLLTELDASEFNSLFHVYPPLRSENDRCSLQKGLKEKIITALCSHHRPFNHTAKYVPFPESEPGMATIQTLLVQTLRVAKNIDEPLKTALSWVTNQPANVLGIPAGTLKVGSKADVCIFDPHVTIKADEINNQHSPFLDWDLSGQVKYTLIAGDIVFKSSQ